MFRDIRHKTRFYMISFLGIVGLACILLGSMAFIVPQNQSIDISLKISMEELQPDYQTQPVMDGKVYEVQSKMPYVNHSLGSSQIAGILSETGQKLVSYQETLMEEEKRASQVMGQSQTVAKTAPQAAVVSQASLNGYENQVLALINSLRDEHGLGQLAAVQSLTDVARSRSADMLARDYFSHHTPEGSTVFDLLRAAGIAYTYGGENLAHSYPASAGSADAFLNAWLNSPSHRANMLKSQYTKVGIGLAENGGRRVVTTVFSN